MSLDFFRDSIALVNKTRDPDSNTAWIPMPWKGLSDHVGIAPGQYHYIGGDAGSGKTAVADYAYIINPWKYVNDNPDLDIDLHVFAWKMERPIHISKLKWIALELWERHRILISVKTLAGWESKKAHIPNEIYDKIVSVAEELEPMSDRIHVYPATNPTGIRNTMLKWLHQNGKFEEHKTIRDEKEEIVKNYVPSHPNRIVICLVDHVAILNPEREGSIEKGMKGGARDSINRGKMLDEAELMRRFSGYARLLRDKYQVTMIILNQFNRNNDDTARRKYGVQPVKSDFHGASKMYQDADVVMGLVDPSSFRMDEYQDYDIDALTDSSGNCRFRAVHVLKNSYGQDNIFMGLGFAGEVGWFRQLPPADKMLDSHYEKMRSLSQRAAWTPDSR